MKNRKRNLSAIAIPFCPSKEMDDTNHKYSPRHLMHWSIHGIWPPEVMRDIWSKMFGF